ncbi:MAG: hypothetical protein IIA87_03565 [Nanoarchaeota archaeon]|nr:hypothetical protein [Nanoarchaeota archaeon]
MICKYCKYNKKPIGRALDDANKGRKVKVKLNANGWKHTFHITFCYEKYLEELNIKEKGNTI